MSATLTAAAIMAGLKLAQKGYQNWQAGKQTDEEAAYAASIASREKAATDPQGGLGAEQLSRFWDPQQGDYAKQISDLYRGSATTASGGASGVAQQNILNALKSRSQARLGATSAAAADIREKATAAGEQALAGKAKLADWAIARKKMKMESQAGETGVTAEEAGALGEAVGGKVVDWMAKFGASSVGA